MLQDKKSLSHVSAIKYGQSHENVARSLYEKMFKCKVIQVGLLISSKQPWACASLDGVVLEDLCIVSIVNIKCPESCKDKPVINFDTKECNVNFLKFDNDEVKLIDSKVYYTQCQYQMYISGLSECDLFVFSPIKNGSYCVRVLRDETFLKDTVLECERFYFENILPALYKVFNKKRNDSPKRLQLKAKKRLFTGVNVANIMLD